MSEPGGQSEPGGTAGMAGAAAVADARGRRCPFPVIELAKLISTVREGELVAILADDEAARLDIPAWCGMRGQEYLGEQPQERGSAYLVRKLSSP